MVERQEYKNYLIKKCFIFVGGDEDSINQFIEECGYSKPYSIIESIFDLYGNIKGFIVICDTYLKNTENCLRLLGLSHMKDYLFFEELKCVLSKKKIAIFYGVCTQRAICECLKFSNNMKEEYELFYWLSYRALTPKEYNMFILMLKICDLFIYNACILEKWKKHNEIILKGLNKDCMAISLPIISSRTYHPQTIKNRDRNNQYSVTSSKTYYAPFLSPDCNINEMIDKGYDLADILAEISDQNFYDRKWLENNMVKQTRHMELDEASADIKISDFIKIKHGKERLFLNEKHISNIVLTEFARRILAYINKSDDLPEDKIVEKELLFTTEVPLYPSVVKGLGLEEIYKDRKYKLFTFKGEKTVTFEEYICLYYEFSSSMAKFMKKGFFPE